MSQESEEIAFTAARCTANILVEVLDTYGRKLSPAKRHALIQAVDALKRFMID